VFVRLELPRYAGSGLKKVEGVVKEGGGGGCPKGRDKEEAKRLGKLLAHVWVQVKSG